MKNKSIQKKGWDIQKKKVYTPNKFVSNPDMFYVLFKTLIKNRWMVQLILWSVKVKCFIFFL